MATDQLDRVYTASGNREMRAVYDDWAKDYDDDVAGNGYRSPARAAAALAEFLPDKDALILDYGCGTGLSGSALAAAGFTNLVGADLSSKMLDIARELDVYSTLDLVEPDQPLPADYRQYDAIVAVGLISKGAAPPEIYRELLSVMRPSALLVFSMNDLSLVDPLYAPLVEESIKDGLVRPLKQEHGPHLPGYANNEGSMIYVLERL